MLKRVMFFVMSCYSTVRFMALAYMLSTQFDRLPIIVYFTTGVTVLTGLFWLCKRLILKVKTRQLELYYLLTAATAIFNLLFVKYSSRIEATMLDFIVIGTALDVVISVTFLVLAERERKYIKIPVQSDQ